MRSALFLALVAALAAGCKAKPAKPAGFVDSSVDASGMKKHDDLPFHRAWRNEKGDFKNYEKIYIAPVDTSHLLQMDWLQKGEAGASGELQKDIEKIAVEFRQVLKDSFKTPPEGVTSRFTVVDKPGGKDTLVLEFSIVQIVPSKATLEALSWVMPFGTGILLTPLNTSSAAMEGMFRDSSNKLVLLAFADREGEQARPVDLAGFTWYTHARGIMKDWARQLVLVANQKPGEKIPDTKTFTLKPW